MILKVNFSNCLLVSRGHLRPGDQRPSEPDHLRRLQHFQVSPAGSGQVVCVLQSIHDELLPLLAVAVLHKTSYEAGKDDRNDFKGTVPDDQRNRTC